MASRAVLPAPTSFSNLSALVSAPPCALSLKLPSANAARTAPANPRRPLPPASSWSGPPRTVSDSVLPSRLCPALADSNRVATAR
jgi:hypothetical protein